MSRVNGDGGHYRHGGMEPLDYIVANEMGFREGSIVKLATRFRFKGADDCPDCHPGEACPKHQVADLRKIQFFVCELIEGIEAQAIKEPSPGSYPYDR